LKIHNNILNFIARNPIVTIGMFDGVHSGHRSILQHLIDEAKTFDGESVVLSFWPHPRMLFEGENCSLKFLTSNEEKAILLDEIGIDHFILYPFTREFSSLSPRQYVENILVKQIGVKKVIIGYDHRFGFKGAGGFVEMVALGAEFGFEVEQISAFEIDQENISSSKIREALKTGDITLANSYLSYEYSILGTVVKGNQVGRTIGYPTVNIEPTFAQKLIPGNGIYVVEVEIENVKYKAVANVGNRPTVVENQIFPNVEAFIFDFNRDVYGKAISILFKHKLRDELKFSSLEKLVEQIGKDVENAKQWFAR
jgi:riboflavin kinase / FMN adenylyltransferase